jgi:hypothetical protein
MKAETFWTVVLLLWVSAAIARQGTGPVWESDSEWTLTPACKEETCCVTVAREPNLQWGNTCNGWVLRVCGLNKRFAEYVEYEQRPQADGSVLCHAHTTRWPKW